MRYVVEVSSGRFLYGGFYEPLVADSITQQVVDVPGDRTVDLIRERYDAQATARRRPATSGEISEVLDLQKDEQAQDGVQQAIVKSTVAWVLFKLLGRLPTGAELTTALSQWKTAFKNFS